MKLFIIIIIIHSWCFPSAQSSRVLCDDSSFILEIQFVESLDWEVTFFSM